MSFKKSYPVLYQFFGAYFPDADIEGLTDEEVTTNYIIDSNKSEKSKTELEQTKKELSSLMCNIEDYWQEVSDESNRFFESPSDALEWLAMINHKLHQ
ncbi:contact-dependent growth inhibition system immunity protein [Niabella hibiscisoli]|uniref:contact-dependent growth inhibition system immunity protein n=1 Tax=Niabella hibiscisoli TaxID=1825928 RepID=UPI001F0EFCC6|nr:contact-dependent growth inhibition system immunity protein [Niabella hibiscisoli]MCH5720503.1 contact-dependent growth inhibition system immunity protein [Niabella hibiscisoli]